MADEMIDGSSVGGSTAPFDPTAKLLELANQTAAPRGQPAPAVAPAAQAVPKAGSAFDAGAVEEPSPEDFARAEAKRQSYLNSGLRNAAEQALGVRKQQEPAEPAPAEPEVPEQETPDPDGLMRPPADVRAAKPPVEDLTLDPDAPKEVQAKDPKAVNAWTKIKRREKELERMLAEKEAALAEAGKAKPPELEELAALKKQVDEYEEKIGKLSIVESKAFKDRYDTKLNQNFSRGVGILMKQAGKAQEDAVRIMRELVKPGVTQDQFQDLLGDLVPAVQGMVGQTVYDFHDTVSQREQAINEWKSTRAALEEGDQRASMADLSKLLVEGTDAAAKQLASEQSWLYIESKEDPKWNQQREQLVSAARHILREGKQDEIVKYVMEGVAAARYRSFAEAESRRADKLQDELSRRLGVRPKVGGAADVQSAPAAKPAGSTDFESWAAQNAHRFAR